MTLRFQFPVIDTCSAVLEDYLSKAFSSLPLFTVSTTIFHAKKEPKISISNYIDRFNKFSECSESCYIAALIYLDRVIQKTKYKFTLCNIHRLYLAAMVLAIKFNEDKYYDNQCYAAIGGVDPNELRELEIEMLQLLDFRLFIPDFEYKKYLTAMESYYRYLMSGRKKSSDLETDNSADSRTT